MSALLNSANRIGGGVKWGLIVHTLAMFLLLTIPTVINLSEVPILYVDEREFPGGTGLLPRPVERGTFGSIATRIVLVVMPTLRDWLADGLLVRSVQDSITEMCNADHIFPSYIVAMLFIP